ncbi:MAG: transcriptional repressor [Verrucomicrobiae bacterium]|nr:transcriptional repressor [Verrucomicrobiae bacterium]
MQIASKEQAHARFLALLRQAGLPVTTQRRAVFEAMLERQDHPTAEQVYQVVLQKLPHISRMTVHRILNTFVALGVVDKTCHPGSAARFDSKTHPHHHLVCLDCGAIMDVEDPRLDRMPRPRIPAGDFVIEDYQVQFRGRCARCQQKARALQRRPRINASAAPPRNAGSTT